MSVYGRLGYNFDSTKFNGDDVLTEGVVNLLDYSSINLSQWQIDDISNNSVSGYYQNPHTGDLNSIIVLLNGFIDTCNSNVTTFDTAEAEANTLVSTSNTTITSINSFITHTDRMSGVTTSPDPSLYPDLNYALSVGRQILKITNKTDSIQNNTPVMGSFTSLYVGDDITSSLIKLTNNTITLNNSISMVSGNGVSNITSSSMNTIISNVQTLKSLLDTRSSGDISFYVNSLAVLGDYQRVSAFSNLGATQNSLITLIGTNKLKTSLQTQ